MILIPLIFLWVACSPEAIGQVLALKKERKLRTEKIGLIIGPKLKIS